MRPGKLGLSVKGLETLEYIHSYLYQYGYAPSQVEIAEHCGVGVRAIRMRLNTLEAIGLIRCKPGAFRAITTTQKAIAVLTKATVRFDVLSPAARRRLDPFCAIH